MGCTCYIRSDPPSPSPFPRPVLVTWTVRHLPVQYRKLPLQQRLRKLAGLENDEDRAAELAGKLLVMTKWGMVEQREVQELERLERMGWRMKGL